MVGVEVEKEKDREQGEEKVRQLVVGRGRERELAEVGGEGVWVRLGEGWGRLVVRVWVRVWEGCGRENSFLEKCLSPFQVSNPISGLKKQKKLKMTWQNINEVASFYWMNLTHVTSLYGT